jgi:hypothetical protein
MVSCRTTAGRGETGSRPRGTAGGSNHLQSTSRVLANRTSAKTAITASRPNEQCKRPAIGVRDVHCPPCPRRTAWQSTAPSASICPEAKTHAAFHRDAAPVRLSCLHRFCPHRGTQMIRFVLSAVVLAGVLAMTNPVFADPLAATASDHAKAAAAAMEQPASPAPAWSSSSDAPATSAGLGKNTAPAGLGWG